MILFLCEVAPSFICKYKNILATLLLTLCGGLAHTILGNVIVTQLVDVDYVMFVSAPKGTGTVKWFNDLRKGGGVLLYKRGKVCFRMGHEGLHSLAHMTSYVCRV